MLWPARTRRVFHCLMYRLLAWFTCQRFGRRIWKKWSGYHQRSLVETKMNCFKRLGEQVMAKTFERQVTELHVRVALLNRFSQLGRPVTMSVS